MIMTLGEATPEATSRGWPEALAAQLTGATWDFVDLDSSACMCQTASATGEQQRTVQCNADSAGSAAGKTTC